MNRSASGPFDSLTFKIGAVVVLIAGSVLAVLGFLYVATVNRTVGERLEEQACLPGRLMNEGTLRLEAAADPEVMELLTDMELLLGMVVGVGGRVYYSSNPEFVGQLVSDVLEPSAPRPEIGGTRGVVYRDEDRVTAMVPVMRLDERTPRFYVYSVLSLYRYNQMRAMILRMASAGSLTAIAVVSVLVFYALRRLVVDPVRSILKALARIRTGDMDTRVGSAMRSAELRALARGVDDVAEIRGRAERSLEEAKRAAEETSEAKSRFLAGISHELRTPLHGIVGMVSLVESGSLSAGQRQALASIRNSAEALHSVIRNILDFTVLESGSAGLEVSTVDMGEIIHEVTESFTTLLLSKGIEIRTSVSPACRYVRTDRFRIQQIVFNLVSNAVKYTDRGWVDITVGCAGESMRLAVSDTGIGIPKQYRESIFESFRQLEDPYTKTQRGLGLGLALVRRTLEILGGSISVEAGTEGGSVFTVDLPVEIVKTESPEAVGAQAPELETELRGAASRAPHSQTAARRILVVEDDAINRLYVSSLLSKHGFEVLQAKDGEEALERAAEDSPRLILMDVGLPKLNGIEATRRIRERELSRDAHTPIIAVTAHAYREDERRCLEAGMDEFLTKPLDESVLLRTIEGYFG